jgi:hypothetical protein
MHELKRILEANGHAVTVIREDRIGFVVFEDDYQVVAEPSRYGHGYVDANESIPAMDRTTWPLSYMLVT